MKKTLVRVKGSDCGGDGSTDEQQKRDHPWVGSHGIESPYVCGGMETGSKWYILLPLLSLILRLYYYNNSS
eukprot:scaffold239141_cov50-Attheya_sp.AAC.1